MELIQNIPEIFFQFLIVLLLSLLIGIEQRRHYSEKGNSSIPFGTDRTFTFIGLLGFILFILDPKNFALFITGFLILGILFGIFYFKKIQDYKSTGVTKILVGIVTYCIGPVVITQPKWLSVLIFVSILILVESKNFFIKFSNKLSDNEFTMQLVLNCWKSEL
jgi:hypothetical protein